jgi:DNA-binding transcriptional MerR regulator
MKRPRDHGDELLFASDVARILNITPNGVRYLEHCGKLPAKRLRSGQRIFRLKEVEALARARGVGGELEPPDAA